MQHPIIIGISGASGVFHAVKLLEILKIYTDIPTAVIISKAAERTLRYETDYSLDDIKALATDHYPVKDIGAKIASGSFKTAGMIIAPCSVKTMSELAYGIADNLIVRAADVCLKERRPVIVGIRETPFHTGHLRTMTLLSEMGAIIAPPLPAFYLGDITVDQMVEQICVRWLSLLGIEVPIKKVWCEENKEDPL